MKKGIFYVALTCFICSACDDFLTLYPEHSLTMDNSVKTATDVKNAVNGIYGEFEGSTYLGGQIYSNLHCMAGLWEYNNTMYNMSYSQSSNDYKIKSIWSQLYGCINAANAAIDAALRIDATEYSSEEEKNALLAEARCFRGYCNLELLWLFAHWFDEPDSPYGIIYRDKTSEMSNLMVRRSTVGDSYKYIIDDLKFAEENLGDYSSARYMSKQFAMAMHAKLLLVRGWDGDYEEALNIVNSLLYDNSSFFMMENDLTQLYINGWDSKEVLFSRYLGDYDSYTTLESLYSYDLFYGTDYYPDLIDTWLKEDERYDMTFGTARSPEVWDTSTRNNVLIKLYHRGRYEGKNDMYATYVFRYPELFIMKAELLARINPSDISGALSPLNEMRRNYTNPQMKAIEGIDNYQDLMDTIFKEYVVTLYMENESPWFASLRFEKDGKPWIYSLKPDINFSEEQYCWPIPDDEIKANSKDIEQNPGLE